MAPLSESRGRGYVATGFQMIRSIDVRNFRCYPHLVLPECNRLNLIVGDNGSGKTALLEAIFFALGNSTGLGLRLRQYRGMEGQFGGTNRAVEQAMWGDMFYGGDMRLPISITLDGDGYHNRSLEISRGGQGSSVLGFDGRLEERSSPMTFTWRDQGGVLRSAVPSVGEGKLILPDTGEDVEDNFFFVANQTIPATENAGRFSALSMEGRHRSFIESLKKGYGWLEDISVEVLAGVPVLFATLSPHHRKLPLPAVSGGVNRVVSILLAMASAPKSVLLIDEIENGVYYSHLDNIWRQVLGFLREYDCQVFVTTHSRECLQALARASEGDLSLVTLWQAERRPDDSHCVEAVQGEDLQAALAYDEEVR